MSDIKAADKKKSYNGTCQACFSQVVAKHFVSNDGRTVETVLHGYKRPGSGVTEGRCLGARELPYELSCDLSKTLLESAKTALTSLECHVSLLVDGRVNEVTYLEKAYNRLNGKRELVLKTYKQSELNVWDWQRQVRVALSEARMSVLQLKNDISMYEDRINSWKFNPSALLRQ